MIMKRWRVGSLSMGLILLASGILMLVSLIIRINVLDVLLTFWPVIMICLGIEILLHLFVRKSDDSDSKLRYDTLSILFISFLLVISIGFYAVTYFAGLFESREDMYAAFGIMSENVYAEDSVTLTGTNELVVFNGINKVTVLSSAEGKLKVEYSVSFLTYDKGYGTTLLDGIVRIESGERAYLNSDTTMFYNNRKASWPMINCIIYLPQETLLDLSQFWGSVEYDHIVEKQLIQNQ